MIAHALWALQIWKRRSARLQAFVAVARLASLKHSDAPLLLSVLLIGLPCCVASIPARTAEPSPQRLSFERDKYELLGFQ